MEYSHTQKAYLSLILLGSAAAILAMLWLPDMNPAASRIVVAAAVLTGGCGLAFHSLTIEDGGRQLVIRFGPVPLFGKRIDYDRITAVEPDRTKFLDGWGIHYFPGRGWTYNLWGFDCVKLTVDGRTIRLGTDDVDGLVAFLKQKIG